jgi:hypothetical protein
MTGEIRTKYCNSTWNTINIYVVIETPLIIVISFIGSANVLSPPKKKIWNYIYIYIYIYDINYRNRLILTSKPSLNVTMSCCVTPYILLKSGKKLTTVHRNLLPQSYWKNTIYSEQGRSRFLRNKFPQDYVVYSPNISPHNLRGANLKFCNNKITSPSIRRLKVGSPTRNKTLIYLWPGKFVVFYMTSHLTKLESTYAFERFC